MLDAQLAVFETIQTLRHGVWSRYAGELAEWAEGVGVELMRPRGGVHAAHVFYLVVPERDDQVELIGALRALNIVATFHYVPLDSSAAGQHATGGRLRPLDRAEDLSRAAWCELRRWAGMTAERGRPRDRRA